MTPRTAPAQHQVWATGHRPPGTRLSEACSGQIWAQASWPPPGRGEAMPFQCPTPGELAGGSESRRSGDGMRPASLTSSWKPLEQRNFREQFMHFSCGEGGGRRASGGPWEEAPNPSSFPQTDSSLSPDPGPRLLPAPPSLKGSCPPGPASHPQGLRMAMQAAARVHPEDPRQAKERAARSLQHRAFQRHVVHLRLGRGAGGSAQPSPPSPQGPSPQKGAPRRRSSNEKGPHGQLSLSPQTWPLWL